MIKLINDDCLNAMKEIPDKSIDMILCDLPYGTTKNIWDSTIPLDKLWKQYERIIKDIGCITLFAQTPFDKILGYSNLKLLKYEWIWQKTMATGFLNAKKMPMKAHENILIFYKKAPKYNPQMRGGFKPYSAARGEKNTTYGKFDNTYVSKSQGNRYPIDILEYKHDKIKLHPTQKPVALLEYLIKTYTNENDLVLDNCMGSGSSGVACINTNRNFIVIELDKEYFEIAKKRIEEAQNNKNL